MLVTKTRFSQAQDPTGVTVARCAVTSTGAVTVPAYQVTTRIPSLAATRLAPAAAFGTSWNATAGEMTKVDFHDRWPLLSTS